MNTPKPGHKTTEFFLTLAFGAGNVAAAAAQVLSPKWASIATGIALAFYALSRGQVKIAATKALAAVAEAQAAQPPAPPAA